MLPIMPNETSPKDDPELLGERAAVFGRVFVLHQHLARIADAALEPLGLTSRQWLLLAVLTRAFPGGAPTLTEAAAVYGSSRQNVKQVARGLVARGYLEMRPDPNDARATRLQVTPRVAEFDSPAGQARSAELLAGVFAGLERDELMVLEHLLGRWLRELTPTASALTEADHRRPTKEAHP